MFAVLKTGGKQYRVQSGDVLRVEKLAAEAGETIQFNDVLMVGANVGKPMLDDAAVQATVIDQIRGDKTIHFVKRRRKHGSKRTKGHRQSLTLVRITDILEAGAGSTGVKAAIGAGSAPRTTATEEAAPATPKVAAEAAAPVEGVRPANLMDAPRESGADDLTRISGVGPKLLEKLNANGIWHFDQIAAWTGAEIAYMDDQLSFKGRIERDGWIEQAKTFAAESAASTTEE